MNPNEQIDFSKLDGFSFNAECVTWILTHIRRGATILELGSGVGSSELGKVFDMVCVENNPEYVGKFPNINYIHAPLKDYGNYNWYDIEAVKDQLPSSYDLLIVDGPLGSIGRKPFRKHKELFRLDVPIMIDDISRKDEHDLFCGLRHDLRRCTEEYQFGTKGFGVVTTKPFS